MINRLFSSFDPANRTISFNLIILLLILIFPLQNKTKIISNRLIWIIKYIILLIQKEASSILNRKFLKGKINIIPFLFIFILLLNTLSLFPYIFTLTAQIMFSLRIALPFWLSFILFSFYNNTNQFLAHLVPLRTPIALSQFIVIIETVRQIIRPITLSVRLAANITAGHILLALISSPIFIINSISLGLRVLVLLEIAVAFIQRYVFVILLTIYISETIH